MFAPSVLNRDYVVVGRTITIDDLFDKEDFKAVFIASGSSLPKFMGIPEKI